MRGLIGALATDAVTVGVCAAAAFGTTGATFLVAVGVGAAAEAPGVFWMISVIADAAAVLGDADVVGNTAVFTGAGVLGSAAAGVVRGAGVVGGVVVVAVLGGAGVVGGAAAAGVLGAIGVGRGAAGTFGGSFLRT